MLGFNFTLLEILKIKVKEVKKTSDNLCYFGEFLVTLHFTDK